MTEPLELPRIIRDIQTELTRTQEQYIFDFFGSLERLKEVGFLYVFEEHPVEIFSIEDSWDDDEFNERTYRITQTVRLRLKTQEELDMLEQYKYGGPLPCPTCGAKGNEDCIRGRKPNGGAGIVGAIWLRQVPFPEGHDSRRTRNKEYTSAVS